MNENDRSRLTVEQGWELLAQGDVEGALQVAENALDAEVETPEAHNLMGFALAGEGHLEEALSHYAAAIEADGAYFEAMLNAAELLIQVGDFPSAIELTEDAQDVAGTPDEVADAMLLRVDALLTGGRRDDAAEVVRDLPIGPFESPQLDFLIGRARFEVGDLEGAGPAIEVAAHQDRHNPDAFYYLGLIREAKGDVRGATVAFLQCRDLDLGTPRPPWSEPIPLFEKKIQAAIARLPRGVANMLEGALILVDEVPGAEAVSEGLDPRLPVLIDDLPLSDNEKLRRCFVYQRNLERLVPRPALLEQELALLLEFELQAAFGTKKRPSSKPPGSTPPES